MIPKTVHPGVLLFYLFVFLSGWQKIKIKLKKKNISNPVIIDTMSDLELWVNEYKKSYGEWGFNETTWLINHFRGNVFKIGRLQFQFYHFPLDFKAIPKVDKLSS